MLGRCDTKKIDRDLDGSAWGRDRDGKFWEPELERKTSAVRPGTEGKLDRANVGKCRIPVSLERGSLVGESVRRAASKESEDKAAGGG